MELKIISGDVTALDVDAVVNAANSSLLGGGGVDGAIHAAGGPEILAECRETRKELPDGLPAGQAVATTAGDLPARWVIHTVGPVYSTAQDRSDTLASCYRESLRKAVDIGAATVAFPAISAGAYGWPLADAAQVAVDAVEGMRAEVGEHIDQVLFVPFGADAERAFRTALGQ